MEGKSKHLDVDNVPDEVREPFRIAPEDIYDQLEDFDFSQQLKQVLEINESLRGEISKLKNEIKIVTERCSRIEKENDNLQVNISTLYKTATTELKRKERMYNEVRTELDDLKKSCNSNPKHVQNTYDRQNPTKNTQPEKAPYQHKNATLEHSNTNRQQVSESRQKYGERLQSDRSENRNRNNPYNKHDRKRPRSPSPHRSNRRSPKRQYTELDRRSNSSRSTSKTCSERSSNKRSRSIEKQLEATSKKFKDSTHRNYDEPSYNSHTNSEMVRSRNENIRSYPHFDNLEKRQDMICMQKIHPNERNTKDVGSPFVEHDNRIYENVTDNTNTKVYLNKEPIDYNYTQINVNNIKRKETDVNPRKSNETSTAYPTHYSHIVNPSESIGDRENYSLYIGTKTDMNSEIGEKNGDCKKNSIQTEVCDNRRKQKTDNTVPLSVPVKSIDNVKIDTIHERNETHIVKNSTVDDDRKWNVDRNDPVSLELMETFQSKKSINKTVAHSAESDHTKAVKKISKNCEDVSENVPIGSENLISHEKNHKFEDKPVKSTKSKNSSRTTKLSKYNNLELITLKCRNEKSEKKSIVEIIPETKLEPHNKLSTADESIDVLKMSSISQTSTGKRPESSEANNKDLAPIKVSPSIATVQSTVVDKNLSGSSFDSSVSSIDKHISNKENVTIESLKVEESLSESSLNSSMLTVSDSTIESHVSVGPEDTSADASIKSSEDRSNVQPSASKHTMVTSTKVDNNTITFTVHRKRSRIIKN